MAIDPNDFAAALVAIREQAIAGNFRVTLHAIREMVARSITLEELLETINSAEVLEIYPEHQRGSCCLLNGTTAAGRPIHVVCTTSQPMLIIITAYEPQAPKWKNPRSRNR